MDYCQNLANIDTTNIIWWTLACVCVFMWKKVFTKNT